MTRADVRRRRLIVNADGYGFTPGVNRAIEDTCVGGFVRSTSVVANFPAVADLAGFVRRFPGAGIGVHFNLSVGPPVLPANRVPSLVGPDGELWGRAFPGRLRRGLLDVGEMEAELAAQVARIRRMGATITHWDSHQGMHVHEPFLTAATRCARRFGIERMRTHAYWLPAGSGQGVHALAVYLVQPARVLTFSVRRALSRACRRRGFRMADRSVLLGVIPGTAAHDEATWRRLLQILPAGTSEVWCHPGYPDDMLRRYAALVDARKDEARVLSDPTLVAQAREEGIELITFAGI